MSDFGDFSPLDLGDELDTPSPREAAKRAFREALFTIVRPIRDPSDRKAAAKLAVKIVEDTYG